MSKTIRIESLIPAPAAEVFAAFTKSERLRSWFAEHADVALVRNRFAFWGRYTPEAPTDSPTRLVSFVENRELRFIWHVRRIETEVSINLAEEDGGTRVTIQHLVSNRPLGHCSMADFWAMMLENLRRFLAGSSEFAFCDYSASPHGGVDEAIDIQAPPDRVYESLIEPAELNRYIAAKATIDPRVGGRYDLGWGEGGPIKILELEPAKKLAYSWYYEVHGDPETAVTWTLEGSGGGTRLTLVHSGFAPDRLTEDYRTGWMKFMNEIKSMIETGPTWKPAKLDSPDHEEEECLD